ncbi:NB-ARC domain-containing protein [Yersinia ruckeri]|uniref:NB-ARC domain-containing protein n=1 Tax=Yersinia ruckeri TaxID=29486 RepID=UPI0005364845|nr:NB-ARC domain-containing protein [Yersinia ruckeri]AUQ42386.1 AAA family ATPase [Yersinia ruckeri]EKN4687893.1 Abi family protein [Yersinia ruckeri]WMS04087.1 NB-ARC domain-containing protein [Yersinia ruckeri]
MASRNFATRMSCFSLISSIETDLRTIIINELQDGDNDYNEYLPIDIIKVAKERFYEHKKEVFSKELDLLELLDFIDFYDLSKILHKISNVQKIFKKDDVTKIANDLEKLTKCRNRVCHSRPLEPNDFMNLLDFSYELITMGKISDWKSINKAIKNLDNPGFALSLEIPSFWKVHTKTISNNLPLPEFDDTGFMGRDKDRKSINKLIMSNTKVISIVGEGGVGKTALAQRCLYDILEVCESDTLSESIFDIIVWVSLKTNRLTVNGTSQIKNAINSSSGLFQEISFNLMGDVSNNIDVDLNEILEYMSEFKILLCIDNLETISSSEVRDFLADIPNNSKVIITTRIGLGEIEYRYKLDKLDDKPSVELMKNMSRLLNVEKLYKKKNDALSQLCKLLYNNPLLIKWYVLAVAAGNTNSELINKQSKNFQEALCFCFESLYDKLGEIEKQLISVIACIRKPVSAVELRFFLSGTPDLQIEEALHQLHNSSMLISTGDKITQAGQVYNLTSVAEEYINTVRPVPNEIYQDVKIKRKELQSIVSDTSVKKNHYNYDLNIISWSTRDEKICSIYLKKALFEAKTGSFLLAEEHIKKAKSLMPGFSECYRIHSFILKDSSPFKAEVEMEKAIEINPDSVVSRYAYAQFLISEEEFERANEQIDEALRVDSEDIALKTCKAWILTLNGDYKSGSKLYEELIPNQSSRHRKFRISTYDQAASCYRRMAEQYIKDSDYSKAKFSLERGVELIEAAVNTEDYDHGTIKRLFDIFNVTEVYYTKTSDFSIIKNIFNFIDANLNSISVNSLQAIKLGLEQLNKNNISQYSYKIEELLEKFKPVTESYNSGRVIGTIDKVMSTDRGVSYGFIIALDQNRYFFHRSELYPATLLDDDDSIKNVSFIVGNNDKGMCALDIRKR